MQTYTLTVWLLWPKVAGQQASEIVRHTLSSVESCRAWADYYTATATADGVMAIAFSCIQSLGV